MDTSQQVPRKPARDAHGRLLPGGTANPGGRTALPDAFKEKGPEALEKLVEFMAHADPRIALRATEVVTERIYGKAAQPLEHEAGAEMLDILAERLQKRLAKG